MLFHGSETKKTVPIDLFLKWTLPPWTSCGNKQSNDFRRGVRVVESARLESVYTAKPYRGFESLPLRHFLTIFSIHFVLFMGTPAPRRRGSFPNTLPAWPPLSRQLAYPVQLARVQFTELSTAARSLQAPLVGNPFHFPISFFKKTNQVEGRRRSGACAD